MKITTKSLRQLVERQNFRCALTGRDLTPATAAPDHIMPVSRGGDHTIENIAIVHVNANRAKGTMTLDEFVALCREVVAYADRPEKTNGHAVVFAEPQREFFDEPEK